MSKFTKGPWAMEGSGYQCRVVYPHGHLMCPPIIPVDEDRMPGESWLEMRERTAPERMRTAEEAEANARLIAAAPDMYDALTALLDALDANGSCQYERLREEGRAALAKATGNDE